LPEVLAETSALTGLVFIAALVLLLVLADEPEALLAEDFAVVAVVCAALLAAVSVLSAALEAVDADVLTAALVVAADALRALLTAGVLTLAAEVTRVLATAPRRIWADAELARPKEAITMVAMIVRFIIDDFESISNQSGICYPLFCRYFIKFSNSLAFKCSGAIAGIFCSHSNAKVLFFSLA
jgi:hypothetical protein